MKREQLQDLQVFFFFFFPTPRTRLVMLSQAGDGGSIAVR